VRYATQPLDGSYRLIYSEPDHASHAQPTETFRKDKKSETTRLQAARLRPGIVAAAQREGVSASLAEAVVAIESRYNPLAVSAKGALGAMQLMPDTAARYGLTRAAALQSPQLNIDAGVRYLRDLLASYKGNVPLALAAYNAGPAAVTQHHERIPPYRETMLYVSAVMSKAAQLAASANPSVLEAE
jgi:soluble lytic murein transglycosylase-like protein